MYVVRTDKTGTLIWQKTIGGLDWDFGNCVIETSDGGFVICGNTYSFGYGKSDGYLVRLDLSGNFVWQKTFGKAEDDNFKSLIETYNNQLAIVGGTGSYGDVDGDAWLFKTELDGDSLLSARYGGVKKDFLNDLIERPNSKNYILVGATDYDLRDSTHAFIMECDENANYIGQTQFSYHNMLDAQFNAIAALKDPFSALVRKQFNSNQNRKLEPFIMVMNTIFDIPGGVSPYGSPEDDDLHDVVKTRDKGFVCVGYTRGFNANLTDVYIVKIDSNYSSVTGGPSIVGINEAVKHEDDFFIYPTVTTGDVILENNTNSITDIYVSDCLGKLIYRARSKEFKTKLDLGNFSEGLYFITISENNYSKTFKIIKSN
jgi:hypothetical protein